MLRPSRVPIKQAEFIAAKLLYADVRRKHVRAAQVAADDELNRVSDLVKAEWDARFNAKKTPKTQAKIEAFVAEMRKKFNV